MERGDDERAGEESNDDTQQVDGGESTSGESTVGAEGATAEAAAEGDGRSTPALADQGKDVVDTRGADVGMVSDVDGETLYVDPDPNLTEAVMSKLHWREKDRDDHAVPPAAIERIDDDVVVLDVEFDAEMQDPSDPGSRA